MLQRLHHDCTCMKTMRVRKMTKVLWLSLATQLPTQGQWWSITSTQRSHTEQCFDRTTLGVRHVQQCGAGAEQLQDNCVELDLDLESQYSKKAATTLSIL